MPNGKEFHPLDLSKNTNGQTARSAANQPSTTQRLEQQRSHKSAQHFQKSQRKSRQNPQLPQHSQQTLRQNRPQQFAQQPPPPPPHQLPPLLGLQTSAQLVMRVLGEPLEQIVLQSFESPVEIFNFVQLGLQPTENRFWQYIATINELLRYIPVYQLLFILQRYNETTQQMLNLYSQMLLVQLYQQQGSHTTKPQTTTAQPLFKTASSQMPLFSEPTMVAAGVDRTAQHNNDDVYRNVQQIFQATEQSRRNPLQENILRQESTSGAATVRREASTESLPEKLFVIPRPPSRSATALIYNTEILDLTSSISAPLADWKSAAGQCPQAQQQQGHEKGEGRKQRKDKENSGKVVKKVRFQDMYDNSKC